MLGKLQPNEIEALLKTQIVGRLGCSADGNTYVVPISYVYDGSYIYWHSEEGQKTQMVRKNPKICFEVDELNNMANWKSVVVQGECEELKDQQERDLAMQALLSRYLPIISSATTHLGPQWPFHSDDLSQIDGVIFRIKVKEKSGRFESDEQSPAMAG